jgi:hypothetical protein
MDLRQAIETIHADRDWWRKVLIGGALKATLLGYPLGAGLVVESLDNTRKGFPTPLPPWTDLSTRFILGLFAFLIDFLYFILPFFIGGLLFFCVGLTAVLSRNEASFGIFSGFGSMLIMIWVAIMFLIGVSPVGRLVFVQDGSPEGAMSLASLRETLRNGVRGTYLRARLISLPAYLPFAVVLALLIWVIPSDIPFSWLIALVLYWLLMSTQLYAHLIIIQIFAGAERVIQDKGLERLPPM